MEIRSTYTAGVLSKGETVPSREQHRGLAGQLVLSVRALLWIAVLILTGALVFYPREPQLSGAAIQSTESIDSLPLFLALFTGWMAAIVASALVQDRHNQWAGLVLAVMFVVVFRGFWDIPYATSGHQDSLLNTATADYIRSTGKLAFAHPSLVYTDFPGLHLLTASLAEVLDVPTTEAAAMILVMLDIALASTFFLIAVQITGDGRLATLAALIGMEGNIVFARMPFYPGTLGLLFGACFLLVSLKQNGTAWRSPGYALVATLLFGASVITHLITALLIFFLAVGHWLFAMARNRLREPLPTYQIMLYACLPIAWLVYATAQTFDSLVNVTRQLPDQFGPDNFLAETLRLGTANTGTSLPSWAQFTTLAWLLILYGVGTLLGLARLRRGSALPAGEAAAIGGLIGIFLLTLTATAVSPGGSQFLRYPMYSAMLLAPVLALGLWRVLGPVVAPLLVSVALITLAAPSFLVYNGTVGMNHFYPPESAAAQTLAQRAKDEDVMLFSASVDIAPYLIHLPNAAYDFPTDLSKLKDEQGARDNLGFTVQRFLAASVARAHLFVDTSRTQVSYRHNFGLRLDDPVWTDTYERLDSGAAQIYDNGMVTIYAADTQP